MRVCMVTTAFPAYLGDGDGAFIWGTADAVRRAGAEVRLIAMHRPGLPTYEVMDGIEVFRPIYWRPVRHEILRKEVGGLPITWRKYPLTRLQIFPFVLVHMLVTLRLARDSDLIHAHWTLSAASALMAKLIYRTPVIATVQGSDIFRVVKSRLGTYFTRGVLINCNKITALSHALADATAALGVAPEKIQIIPNGVATDNFTPLDSTERERIIVYVGSFIERKGVRYLLTAMAEVLRSFPDYRLVLIGAGPQQNELEKLAAAYGISEKVVFTGFLSQDKVRDWLQRAKIFVLPSLEEGLGVVLLEALACGTPIVASNIGGIVDVVTPDVGKLIPPADAHALAEALFELLEKAPWTEMSWRARRRAVEVYDWKRIGAQYIDVYRSVLANL